MAVLDRVPFDDITAAARQVQLSRAVLTLIAAVLYAVGWVSAKLVGGLWLAAAWSVAAVQVGWREGRGREVSGGS